MEYKAQRASVENIWTPNHYAVSDLHRHSVRHLRHRVPLCLPTSFFIFLHSVHPFWQTDEQSHRDADSHIPDIVRFSRPGAQPNFWWSMADRLILKMKPNTRMEHVGYTCNWVCEQNHVCYTYPDTASISRGTPRRLLKTVRNREVLLCVGLECSQNKMQCVRQFQLGTWIRYICCVEHCQTTSPLSRRTPLSSLSLHLWTPPDIRTCICPLFSSRKCNPCHACWCNST